MKRAFLSALWLLLLTLSAGSASASFSFSKVGNPGNTADSRIMSDGTTGYGAVAYSYAISNYAVTNAQWALFRPDHASAFAGGSLPVQNVSWFDAAQYCNWLTSGNPYEGAYRFDDQGNFLGIDHDGARAKVLEGVWEAIYRLPTEDEWHKAAYYNAAQDAWWLYANGTNDPPVAGIDAQYGQTWPYSGPWSAYAGTQEQNGTYNMMGNLWEWTESSIGDYRVLRGGAYDSQDPSRLAADYRHYIGVPFGGYNSVGFRIVAEFGIIPEPATVLLLAAGGAAIARRRRSA